MPIQQNTKWTLKQLAIPLILAALGLSITLTQDATSETLIIVDEFGRLLYLLFWAIWLAFEISASRHGDAGRSLFHDPSQDKPFFGNWTTGSKPWQEYVRIARNAFFALSFLFGVYMISIRPFFDRYHPDLSLEAIDDIFSVLCIGGLVTIVPVYLFAKWSLKKQSPPNGTGSATKRPQIMD